MIARKRRPPFEILFPEDADWDATRRVFNLALDLRPAAIALPRNSSEVVAAVEFARDQGLRIAPQAAGHNADAYGDLADSLLVDLRHLRGVAIDTRAQLVRVDGGVKWGQVIPRLSDQGLAAVHGSSPDVGVAGYSLGGGLGWLSRKYGLQASNVTAIDVVTADGEHRRVDHARDPDLFWALRGGNGNYGIVTALEFRVHAVEELYAGALFYEFERAPELLDAWLGIAPGLPDECTTWFCLFQFPDLPIVPEPVRGGSFTVVLGAFLGEEREGRELLRPLRALGTAMDTFAMGPPGVLGELAMDPPVPLPLAHTSALLDSIPVDELLAAAGPGAGSPLIVVELRQLGGAVGRHPQAAGACAALPGNYGLLAVGVPADDASAVATERCLRAIDGAVANHALARRYGNFVGHPTDTSTFWDPATWARLRAVKAAYDPDELFRGNHYIPPAASRSIPA